MANDILIDISFSGQVDEIKEKLESDSSLVDFNKLIPMPEDLNVIEGAGVGDDISSFLSSVNPENSAIVYEKYRDGDYNRLLSRLSTFYPVLRDDMPQVSFEAIARGWQYAKNTLKYGYPTWHDWCIDKWGTPKKAFDVKWYENTLTFSVAESPCDPIVRKIAQMFPDVDIEYHWISEEPGALVGNAVLKGKTMKRKEFPEYSKEAFEEFEKYFEIDLADYGYVYDTNRGTYIIP